MMGTYPIQAATALALQLIGTIVWFAVLALCGIRAGRAERRYLTRYRDVYGSEMAPPNPVSDRYLWQPWQLFMDAPLVFWRWQKVLRQHQTEPDLEMARRRVVRLIWLTVIAALFGSLLPVILSSIAWLI